MTQNVGQSSVDREGQRNRGCSPRSLGERRACVWPPFANAEKAMKTRQTPTQSWRMFKLVKLKYKSESRKDCEEYDNTTTIENTDDEEEPELKRKPKKKRYADFVTAETSEVTTDEPNSKDLPIKESTKSKEIPLPVPPAKLPVQDSRKKRVDSPRLQLSLPVGNEDRHRSRSPLSKKGSTGTSQYEDRQRSDASYKSKTNRSEDSCRSSLESQKDIRDSWSDLSRDSPSNHTLFQRSKGSHRSPSGTQRDGHDSGVSRGSQPGGSRDIYRSGSERDSRKSGSEGSRDIRSKEYRYSQEPHLGFQRDRSRSRSGSTESRSRSRHSRDFIRSPSVSHSDRSGSEDRNSLMSRSQQSRDSNRSESHRSFDYRRSGSLMSDEGQRSGSNLYDDRLGSELLRSSDKDR
ncbi:uncharacterized protein DDB_G0287625-like, partial [Mercenaria mercenaria]|uniref:uncharacterized protein DDB_G0287625-like n=1 Tax=Mercenaria mercenaria TaxID=6596 RepID=UPI00234F02BB